MTDRVLAFRMSQREFNNFTKYCEKRGITKTSAVMAALFPLIHVIEPTEAIVEPKRRESGIVKAAG